MLGPFTFCGSKAGATFCLPMISIVDCLKPPPSQRCRNGLPSGACTSPRQKISSDPQSPPPWCVGGAGDAKRSHGLKLDYNPYLSQVIARMMTGRSELRAMPPIVIEARCRCRDPAIDFRGDREMRREILLRFTSVKRPQRTICRHISSLR